MTKHRFKRINGHAPSTSYEKISDRWRAICCCECGTHQIILIMWGKTEDKALRALLDAVLKEHGRICMDKAGWKCEQCGSVCGLSAHHKVFRSRDRDDRVENLEALCVVDHFQEHLSKSAYPCPGVRPA